MKSEYRDNKPMLPINVSDEQLNRAYRIVDAMMKTIEEMEGWVSVRIEDGKDRAALHVAHTSFSFNIYDEKKPVRKSKVKGISKDNKAPEVYLVIELVSQCWYDHSTYRLEYKDTEETTLEFQIGKIVYDMFVEGSRLIAWAEMKSREWHRNWEEEKKQQRREARRDEERKRVEVLKGIASDWDVAQKIRRFADEVEQKASETNDAVKKERLLNWIKWARARADWLDPLTETDDELLGRKTDFLDEIEDLFL